MRILVHDYAGHPFQIQLSRELARRGHSVLHAYAGELETPRGALSRRVDDPPTLEIVEVPMDSGYAANKYSFVRRRSMEIQYGKEAGKLITRWRPEVVLSGNTPTESQSALIGASNSVGAHFVYWVQDFYSLAVDKLARKKLPLIGGAVGSWYKRLDRRHFASSSAIITITDDFKPILAKDFGVDTTKVSTIPNWGPLAEIGLLPKDNEWSRAHGLQDKFCYLYTGTLGMKHNPELLLQLAKQNAGDDLIRIVVVSEGIGARWLSERVEAEQVSNLLILPYQPFEDLPMVLASGDVLVAVLEQDAGIFSVPSKVLTYLCAARPLLAAVPHENLVSRLVTEQEAGRVVSPSDIDGFVKAGSELRINSSLARKMSENARRYAMDTFDISVIGSRFESVFQSIRISKPNL